MQNGLLNRTQILQAKLLSWRRLPFLFLAFVTLILIFSVIFPILSFPDDGFEWSRGTGQIAKIYPNRAAAQAGIMRGDQIVAVDGVALTEIYSLYQGKQSGQEVRLTLLRAGEKYSVSLQLTDPSLRELVIRTEPLLIAFFFWIVALIAFLLHPRQRVIRLFFLLSQASVGMLATGVLSGRHRTWSLFFNFFLLLLAPLTLHFYASFPHPLPAKRVRQLLPIFYGGATLLLLTTIVVNIVLGEPIEPAWLFHNRRLFVAVTLLVGLSMLLRKPQQMREVKQRRLLIAGMIMSLLPLLSLSFLPQLLLLNPLVDYPWTFPFLILLPLSYALAVYKGELGTIDRFLNRSLVYSSLTGLLLVLYGLLFWTFWPSPQSWGSGEGRIEGQGIYVGGTLLTVLAVVFYGPIRAWLQRKVDHLFYGGWYDYRSVVVAASHELRRVQSVEELSERLFEMARTMHFRGAVLLWSEEGMLVPKHSFDYPLEIVAVWRFAGEGELAHYLTAHPHPQWRGQIYLELAHSVLTSQERTMLAEERLHFWLPLVSQGQLYGLLILGERRAEMALEREDLDILSTVLASTALVAENVALLTTLRLRLAEVEKVRDELRETQRRVTQAREEERLHLAQELHDGAMQELIAVRTQLFLLSQVLPGHTGSLAKIDMKLEQITATLRTLCSALRPPALISFGLELAIRAHAEELLSPTLDVQFSITSDGPKLPQRIELMLFRIYQQAQHNIMRHANAKHVSIRLQIDSEQAFLEVQDDGCGFVVPTSWLEFARRGHFGLLGAAERAESIGGCLEVVSEEGQGTRLRVRVQRLALTPLPLSQ